MVAQKEVSDSVHLAVENVGGIDDTELTLEPGVTVLAGHNATNRTSLLQSLIAAMGSSQATLKRDADEGYVRLTYRGETYERKLVRQNGTVQFTGEGYLPNPEVAELFAFLLETNQARKSIADSGQLRDVIMQPVDSDAIEAEIDRLGQKKEELSEELATIESRESDLTELERQRDNLRDQINDKREDLADVEGEIDESSHDVQESRQVQEELEDRLSDLRSTRSELESVRQKIESEEASIQSLKQERSEIKTELADFPDTPRDDMAELEEQITRLRTQRQAVNSDISDLQSLIQYNEDRLESEDFEVMDAMETELYDSNGSVTDQLLDTDGESVVCWTCGSTVERKQIADTVDRLRSLRAEKLGELESIKSELEDLKQDKKKVEKQNRLREAAENKLTNIETELDQRTGQLDVHKERRDELKEDVDRLESAVEELESENFEEILELHWDANQLEFDIDQLETELDDVTDEIEEVESLIERADDLRAEREGVSKKLTKKRNEISQIEKEAVEVFNGHMETVLELLEYSNLERIWIERANRETQKGRRKVEKTVFELHIVRSTANGAAYEDTIDHLSESEREVVGLIFALAGYLVHDLHEIVPFMLLDSLEAIDADRIAELIDYFVGTAEYIVVALLTEDAQALDEQYARVTSI